MKLDAATAKIIADQLLGPYCSIDLRVDGYQVKAVVQRVSTKSITYGVMLFIDGWFKGEYCKIDNPIGAKFFPLRSRLLHSSQFYADWRKTFGKRKEAELRKRTTYQYRECYFRSGRAFANHLRKHADSVEIIEHEATPE